MENLTVLVNRFEYFDDRFYKILIPESYELPETFPASYKDGDNIFLPSVTTYLGIISEHFLSRWRGDVGNERADYISWKARELGSEIHNLVEQRLRGKAVHYITKYDEKPAEALVTYSQEVAVQLYRYETLIKKIKPIIISAEQTVFNIEECYAGTTDQLWRFDEDFEYLQGRTKIEFVKGHYLVDIKTGRNVNETSYFAQLSAYANAENYKHFDIQGVIILHLNNSVKSGVEGVKMFVKDKSEIERYYKYFLSVKETFLFNNDIEPILYEIPSVFDEPISINPIRKLKH